MRTNGRVEHEGEHSLPHGHPPDEAGKRAEVVLSLEETAEWQEVVGGACCMERP